jgi:putative ABC transport system substrate-binding protein
MMRATLRYLLAVTLLALVGAQPHSAQATQPPLSPIQQMFIMKKLKPDVERVGVIWTDGAKAHDEMMPSIRRAAAASNVKLFVAYVQGPKDVSAHFRKLVSKHDIQTLWIVDDSGVLSTNIARNYLIKNTTQEGIPILAPSQDWVSAGASVAMHKENGEIRLVLNKAATTATAITVPADYEAQAEYL